MTISVTFTTPITTKEVSCMKTTAVCLFILFIFLSPFSAESKSFDWRNIPDDLKPFYFAVSSSSGFYFFDNKEKLKNGDYFRGKADNFREGCFGIYTGGDYYEGDVKGKRFQKSENKKKYQEIKVSFCETMPIVNGRTGFHADRYLYGSRSEGPYFNAPSEYTTELIRILNKAITEKDRATLALLKFDFSHHPVSQQASVAITEIDKQEAKRIAHLKATIEAEYKSALRSSSIEEKNQFASKWRRDQSLDDIKYKELISEANYTRLLESIFKLYSKDNELGDYIAFLDIYKGSSFDNRATAKIFNIVKREHNISGYEWFIDKFPKASEVKQSIAAIHRIAFEEAKNIDTLSAYNTFVITYPSSVEAKEAQSLAYDIEEEEYLDIGFFSFYDTDEKMEKMARKLLIKAKQIERDSKDYNRDARLGYVLVTNRMYDLLQKEFDDSEATLRHLESKEFQDFVGVFKRALREVNSRLDNITKYAKEAVYVSKKGFESASADRAMASFKQEQHREWEKYIQLREKGYN